MDAVRYAELRCKSCFSFLEGVGDCWIDRDGADGRLYLHGFFD